MALPEVEVVALDGVAEDVVLVVPEEAAGVLAGALDVVVGEVQPVKQKASPRKKLVSGTKRLDIRYPPRAG
jgi:hypothetical protein